MFSLQSSGIIGRREDVNVTANVNVQVLEKRKARSMSLIWLLLLLYLMYITLKQHILVQPLLLS